MNNATLDKAKKGNPVTILNLPEGEIKVRLIRLGISEGDTVHCLERLPGGTMVIQKNRQEIAIGFDLAKKIKVILQ
ncbi:MAG: ferrous iron transport protein A [Melioribacteraceae bacterium]|nr:MAG: ferrous iron transport protein A [Melioribacteraceae bacterium]